MVHWDWTKPYVVQMHPVCWQLDFWFFNNDTASASGPVGVGCDPEARKEPGLALQLEDWAFFFTCGDLW